MLKFLVFIIVLDSLLFFLQLSPSTPPFKAEETNGTAASGKHRPCITAQSVLEAVKK